MIPNSTQLVPWYCLATFLLNLLREVLESWTTVFLEWTTVFQKTGAAGSKMATCSSCQDQETMDQLEQKVEVQNYE
jgi:hypothetical protein